MHKIKKLHGGQNEKIGNANVRENSLKKLLVQTQISIPFLSKFSGHFPFFSYVIPIKFLLPFVYFANPG